jgi:hypothetical protein
LFSRLVAGLSTNESAILWLSNVMRLSLAET